MFDVLFFLMKKMRYCVTKIRVANMMCRSSDRGDKASGDLVLTLGTGFKVRDFMGDAVLDSLVVTGFKMQ